jgi:hypothetical protein
MVISRTRNPVHLTTLYKSTATLEVPCILYEIEVYPRGLTYPPHAKVTEDFHTPMTGPSHGIERSSEAMSKYCVK